MIGKRWMIFLLAVGVAVGSVATAISGTEDVPRMDKETLKGMLDNSDVLIVDVRTGKDWDASEFKIKNAKRMDPGEVDSWKGQLRKDKTLVLYCA